MAKSKLPRPHVQANRGSDDGSYKGVLGTKSPTGSRPVPTIARDDPHDIMAANIANAAPVKVPIEHTPMPAPSMKRLSKAPKSEGGGKY